MKLRQLHEALDDSGDQWGWPKNSWLIYLCWALEPKAAISRTIEMLRDNGQAFLDGLRWVVWECPLPFGYTSTGSEMTDIGTKIYILYQSDRPHQSEPWNARSKMADNLMRKWREHSRGENWLQNASVLHPEATGFQPDQFEPLDKVQIKTEADDAIGE